MFRTFTVSISVANTNRSRSSTGEIGTTCGVPSRRVVARCPTRAAATNSVSAPESGEPESVTRLPDLLDDLGVRERGDVAERVAACDIAQEPAHDLAGARLR